MGTEEEEQMYSLTSDDDEGRQKSRREVWSLTRSKKNGRRGVMGLTEE